MNPFIQRLVREGDGSQQIWFAAACVERSVGILFWVVSLDGRSDDAQIYKEMLESLWSGTADNSWDDYVTRLEGMSDLESGHERGGVAPYAFGSAALIHSCLSFGRSRYSAGLAGISDEATNNASQIGFRTKADLAGEEVGEQMSDSNNILLSDAMPGAKNLIRERARAIGRARALALKAWADEHGI